MSEQNKKNQAKEPEFDKKAYDKVVNLTFESKLRKLKAEEVKDLSVAKEIAYKNKGRKAKKTNTYRVNMKTIKLIEGLAVPDSVYNAFSEKGKKDLFVG